MDDVVRIVLSQGLPGAVLVGLGYYILFKDREHKIERDEWSKAHNEQMTEIKQVLREIHSMTIAMNQIVTQFIQELLERKRDGK